MKRIILVLLLSPLISTCFAQRVASDCEAPDSVREKYMEDAQRIALSRIHWFQSSHINNANIPPQWTDSILKALIAVYNAPINKTYTVDGKTIDITELHSRPYQAADQYAFVLNEFSLEVNRNEPWVKDLMQNTYPTNNAQVNNLITKYQLNHSWFSQYANYGALESDNNYNMTAIAKEWNSIQGVYSTEVSSIAGDGSYIIVDTITKDYVNLIYSYGYGDCPAGCINRTNWKYRVNYDCEVEFVSTWEGHLTMKTPIGSSTSIPTQPQQQLMSVNNAPNPFNSYIALNNEWSNARYKILNIMGTVIKQGTVDNSQIGNLEDMPQGVYTLILSSERGIAKTKIMK